MQVYYKKKKINKKYTHVYNTTFQQGMTTYESNYGQYQN